MEHHELEVLDQDPITGVQDVVKAEMAGEPAYGSNMEATTATQKENGGGATEKARIPMLCESFATPKYTPLSFLQ